MKLRARRALAAAMMSSALVTGAVVAAPTASAAPKAPAQTDQSAAIRLALEDVADRTLVRHQYDTTAADSIAAANELLKGLGITPFTPTVGACTDFSISTALGGAVPGPYTPGLGDLTIKLPWPLNKTVDANAIKKGEGMFGFVPVGQFSDRSDRSGMRVAWLNVNTLQSGLGAPMDGLAETIVNAVAQRIEEAGIPGAKGIAETALTPLVKLLPTNGARGGLVETGQGTVLAAIYGTIKNGDATCYYFPSLGIATAK